MLRLRNCALLSLRMFSKSFITSGPGFEKLRLWTENMKPKIENLKVNFDAQA